LLKVGFINEKNLGRRPRFFLFMGLLLSMP